MCFNYQVLRELEEMHSGTLEDNSEVETKVEEQEMDAAEEDREEYIDEEGIGHDSDPEFVPLEEEDPEFVPAKKVIIQH
jgi:hypothetical protein